MNHPEWYSKPNYTAVIGSHLYGTNTEGSDIDTISFVLPPPHYSFGLLNFEHHETITEGKDDKLFSLKKFINLLMQANTHVTEAILSNKYHADHIGSEIRKHSKLFFSQKIYRCIRGYALEEMRKAKCVALTYKFASSEEENIFERLGGKYNLTSLERSQIYDIIFAERPNDPRIEVSTLDKVGERRAADMAAFGYVGKNAMHCIRLMQQGIEMLTTGTMTFPRPNARELLDIRNGRYKLSDIEDVFVDLNDQLDKAVRATALPEKPDFHRINNLYVNLIKIDLGVFDA